MRAEKPSIPPDEGCSIFVRPRDPITTDRGATRRRPDAAPAAAPETREQPSVSPPGAGVFCPSRDAARHPTPISSRSASSPARWRVAVAQGGAAPVSPAGLLAFAALAAPWARPARSASCRSKRQPPTIVSRLSSPRPSFAGMSLDRPRLMGIVNVTPDSFSDGGDAYRVEAAIARGLSLREAGADIVDVGGESTRPGAAPVAPQEEIAPRAAGGARAGAPGRQGLDRYAPRHGDARSTRCRRRRSSTT